MKAPHWTIQRRWGKKASADKPRERRKRLAEMTPEERAAYEVRKAQERARKAEALASMTEQQRGALESARAAEASARATVNARRRARALAALDAHLDALRAPGDLPLAQRESPVTQSDATMRGVVVAEFPRSNGGRRLVLLREWNGRLRILRTLAYVENGRAVRSLGDTLRLYEETADGTRVLSFVELDAEIAALADLRSRLAVGDPALMAQIAAMREARERWERAGGDAQPAPSAASPGPP